MRALLLGFLAAYIAVANGGCAVMPESKGYKSDQMEAEPNLTAVAPSPGTLEEEYHQAFLLLLHVDQHEQGVARFKEIGAPAGPFLLDAMLNPPESVKWRYDIRDSWISEALAYCLTPELEQRLIQVVRDEKIDFSHRKYAMRALVLGETKETREFVIAEFKRVHMEPRDEALFEPHADDLVAAAGLTGSPEVFEGLKRIMNDVRKTGHIVRVRQTIHALGNLKDPRGITVLRDLLDDERWGRGMAPLIYMALIKLGDEDAYQDAMTARQSGEWTDYQHGQFDRIEREHLDTNSQQ